MIRHSCTGDRSTLLEIWKVCFGDNESYINFFLDNGYDPKNCIVWDESGLLVAMLHLRMSDLAINGKVQPAMYIYAAATLPSFRGHGIMAKLIDTAVSYGSSKGCLFTFLLPGSDSLYDYYGKLGFETAFEVKKARLNREELEKAGHSGFSALETSAGEDLPRATETDSTKIYMQRVSFFNPAVQWREKELSYAIAEWKFTGGEVLCFDGGYALCRERDGCVEVKEACGDFAKLSDALLLRYACGTFTFLLPPYADFPFETLKIWYGMLASPSSGTAEQVRTVRPYINLMLD